jgi:hypothetical protein
MTRAPVSLPQTRAFGQTSRRDSWWLFPAITLVYFLSFIVYSTWAAWQGNHYFYTGGGAQYLSPMYSPVLWSDLSINAETGQPNFPGSAPLNHALLGPWPEWLPHHLFGLIPITGAFMILWVPGGFRLTCYYYRGAYYKAFWGDPVNCAVGEPRKSYWGEQSMPLIWMNIHRYFLYFALIFNVILTYDAVLGYIFIDSDGSKSFGVGVGSLVLTLNAILLAGYSFGCHSLRHIVGGKKDCVSASPLRHKTWQCVSCFNRGHMQWAWVSLFWVGFTDLYIRLCSMGIWTDYRLL